MALSLPPVRLFPCSDGKTAASRKAFLPFRVHGMQL